MIDTAYGRTVIYCDKCGAAFAGRKGEEYSKIVKRARKAGWACEVFDGDCEDVCPECK